MKSRAFDKCGLLRHSSPYKTVRNVCCGKKQVASCDSRLYSGRFVKIFASTCCACAEIALMSTMRWFCTRCPGGFLRIQWRGLPTDCASFSSDLTAPTLLAHTGHVEISHFIMCQKWTSSVKSWSSLASTNILSPRYSNVSFKNAGCVEVRLFTADVFFKRIPVWLQNLLELVWHRFLFHAMTHIVVRQDIATAIVPVSLEEWSHQESSWVYPKFRLRIRSTQQLFLSQSSFCIVFCKEYHIPSFSLNPYFFIICYPTFFLLFLNSLKCWRSFYFHNLKTIISCPKKILNFVELSVFI